MNDTSMLTNEIDSILWLLMDRLADRTNDPVISKGLRWLARNRKLPSRDTGGTWRFLHAGDDPADYEKHALVSALLPRQAFDRIRLDHPRLMSFNRLSGAILEAARAVGLWLEGVQ